MAKGKRKSERMWAIVGPHGLYVGTWLTRAEAISGHAAAKRWNPHASEISIWQHQRRLGDRCVRVTITWAEPAQRRPR